MENKFTLEMLRKAIDSLPAYPDPNKKSWIFCGKAYSSNELNELYEKMKNDECI